MKSYVVTGAGSGIGKATAIVLSEAENAKLILVGRHKETLEETRALCKNPSQHLIAELDIRIASQWKSFLTQQDKHFDELSGVFANAGIGGENHYGDDDRWEEILSTNLTGTYVTIMELLPYLKKSTFAFKHVVITASCLARFGVANYTAYCTAKTGLLGLTRSLAVQLANDRILINAICPGWVETDMARAGIQKLADINNHNYEDELVNQKSYVPLNRFSQPAEIGRLVKFLFSDDQTSITGQGIDINNGSFMI